MKLSKRAQSTSVSPIRNLVPLKNTISRVYGLNIGQPDLASPQEFFDGLRTFTSPVLAYDAASGNKSLLDEWSATLNTQYSLNVTPQQLLITSGSSEALMLVFNTCCDVDDEIIVFSPSYANYAGFATITGAKLVAVECSLADNFHLPHDVETQLNTLITERTKALLICNPNNPSGTVYTHDEMRTLIRVCEKHDIVFIVDEVYREFVFDDKKPSCVFELAPENKHVVVVDSISKRYSLCGARIGCVLTWNTEILQAATNFASTRVSAPTVEQVAAAHMLKHISSSYLLDAVQEYEQRRNTLVAGLRDIDGLEFQTPEGGFYVLAKLPVDDSADFARYMLQEFALNDETVFVSPAHAFFFNSTTHTSYVRIAFVLSCDELKQAAKIIKKALQSYCQKS